MDRTRPYSGALRKGLAESLAMFGSNLKALDSTSPEIRTRFVGNAIRTLLKGGSAERWMELDQLMPVLAEAAPLEFLEAVEKGLDDPAKPFEGVFDAGRGTFGTSYHTGLLWALETLAWVKEHFQRAVECLARLASIDPGGNVSNRPLNSLTAILLPWHLQTTADDESRRVAVRQVADRHPSIAWKLILSLLPQGPSSSWPTRKPEWRWKDEVPQDSNKGVPYKQYWADVAYYGTIALELAGSDAERLSTLSERYFHMQAGFREGYRSRLGSPEVKALSSKDRLDLWSSLAQLTTRHRRFADSPQWKVPEEALSELETIADTLEPKEDPFVMHQRLFGGAYAAALTYSGDPHERGEALALKQQEATKELLPLGFEKLAEFASAVESPREFGVALAQLDRKSFDKEILDLLKESKETKQFQLAAGYIMGAHRTGGQAWLEGIQVDRLNEVQRARLLSILPFSDATWALAKEWLDEQENAYWSIVDPRWIDHSSNLEYALRQLLKHGRPAAAINCMQVMVWDKLELNTELVVEALLALSPEDHSPEHEIAELIQNLQDDKRPPREKVAEIEWKFIDMLGEYHQAKPRVLSAKLASDPQFFCEVLKYVYRSDKEKDEERKEMTSAQGQNALKGYALFSSWKQPPGVDEQGLLKEHELQTWLKEVRSSTVESGHWNVAMGQIGEVLYHGPKDETGLWLEPISKILDEQDHDRMRSHLTTEIYNERGIHSPSQGRQELGIAATWQRVADAARLKGYSRLASALDRFAQQYRDEAAIEAEDNPFW